MNPSYISLIRRLALTLGLLASLTTASWAAALNVKNYGARGDGRTDDSDAIAAAIAAARKTDDRLLYFPAGYYRYSRVMKVDGVQIEGVSPTRTIFEATNNSQTAWELTGEAPGISNVAIRTLHKPSRRTTTPQTTGVHVFEAENFLVHRVHVTATASAGIIVRRSGGSKQQPARISDCVVKNPLADGIHLTSGSHYIDVENNQVSGTGDDMIAVVSYRNQPVAVHHINIVNNTLSDQTWGRGVAVVGGNDVDIIGNTIRRSRAAGIYLASEVAYDTSGAWRINVLGNLLDECVGDVGSGHGAIMIFGRAPASGNDNRTGDIVVADNTVRDPGKDGIWCGRYTVSVSLLRNMIERSGDNGMRIGPKATNILMVGNQVATARNSGLAVLEESERIAVLDTVNLGGANSFSNCGQYGIWVNAQGGKGTCEIVGTQISAVNRLRYGGVDAIKLSSASSNYVATITGNRLHYRASDYLDQMWESDIPVATHFGNSKLLEGFVPVYVD